MADAGIEPIFATIDRLAKPLNESIQSFDRTATFPREKWDLLARIGLFGLATDQKYGGLGLDLVAGMQVLERLGCVCEDGGLNFSVATQIITVQLPLHLYGSDEQKQHYLPDLASGNLISAHAITEPDSGSDAYAMRTRATRSAGGYRMSGSKTFVTNGPVADLFAVYALTGEGEGSFGNVSVLLINKGVAGFSSGPAIEKMGLRTSPFCELFFDGCHVPDANIVGKEGRGFGIMETVSAWEIFCVAAIQIGEMQNLLQRCVSYAEQRRQFGKPIGANQAISHRIAEMKIDLEAARAVTYRCADQFVSGRKDKMAISIAKVLTSQAYLKMAQAAVQIFGGYGYTSEFGVERYLRNATASTIYSGTTEIHKNTIYSFLCLGEA